jgi:hypothetical protein
LDGESDWVEVVDAGRLNGLAMISMISMMTMHTPLDRIQGSLPHFTLNGTDVSQASSNGAQEGSIECYIEKATIAINIAAIEDLSDHKSDEL